MKLLVLNKTKFTLGLYSKHTLLGEWSCAVGAPEFETPSGYYWIERKFLNPKWLVPDSEWAPVELRGQLLEADDPRNPLKGAFLKIDSLDGIGIHGTAATWTLGTKASHGCIRVDPQSAVQLWEIIPVGCPILIHE